MAAILQRTLKGAIGCAGIGLHGGKRVNMMLHPAEVGTGIRFRRIDLGGAMVEASIDNVDGSFMCTSIGDGNGASVATIEHLMAAFAGVGVDNVIVDLDGPEVPIMDGSAAPFIFLVECVGTVEQDAPRHAIQVMKPVEIADDERRLSITPSDRFSVSFEIVYDHPLIGHQTCFVDLADGTFKRELSRARTYGFLRDVIPLRERGLALGGSLENAVVLDDEKVLNEGGLRYGDELVRHKALDCIGDFYLAGAPIIGHIHGLGSGHSMNHRLLAALFADRTAWRRIVLDESMAAAQGGWRDAVVAASA